MPILSATKETTLQKKRNLFGLGLISLIAACGGDVTTNAGSNSGEPIETEEERIAREAREAEEAKRIADEKAQAARADALPVKALALSENESGFTATPVGNSANFEVELSSSGSNTMTLLPFADGKQDNNNSAGVYKLTPNLGQYDLVIASYTLNQIASPDPEHQKGRIFIYWDIAKITESPRLEVKGAKADDQIGTFAPDFYKINGGNNYDMVIRSHWVDKPDATLNAGAIYILWDVIKYIGESKTIDLGKLADDDMSETLLGQGATAGSLAIYGAKADDNIGTTSPEFLQLAGDNQKQDMIIKAPNVDFDDNAKNVGAIYIFWDVADHNSATNPAAKVIHLGAKSGEDNYAEFGLLSIYGAHAHQNADATANQALGFGNRKIIYKVDGDNKTLGDIDNDGIKDIVLKDDVRGAYILFGDQVLSPGAGGKIVSKTINLAKVTEGIGELNSGFFSYDFNTHVAASSSKDAEDRVGYRFNGEYLNFSDVKSAYEGANPLSEADADLGVWDIA